MARSLSLLRLLRWCHHNWSVIAPSIEWLAKQLKCSIRTVKRALSRIRFLLRMRRRARGTAVIELLPEAFEVDLLPVKKCKSVTSSEQKKRESGTSLPIREEKTDKIEERTPRKPPAMETSMNEPQIGQHPAKGFEPFFGMFLAAGKKLNSGDWIRGVAKWTLLSDAEKFAAMEDARQQLMRTKDPRFMPLPENYLAARPWTRVAMPRTLPYIDPATDKALQTHEEVLRLLEERMKGAA